MAFRTQKISQMTPKGADLEATDLIEVSTIESGSYVTRSITGQELIDAIPPTTIEWGDIGGTLSNQTDLNTALNGKVPTTRTLTINGVAQDLSADRSWTIATGLTIGTTPIASGTIGRVLFQGTGNVLQQSSSLFWDDAQVRFQLGTTSTRILNFRPEDTTGAYGNSSSIRGGNGNGRLDFYSATNITELRDNIIILTSVGGPSVQVGSSSIALNLGGTRLQVAPTTGNVLINTTTDAGFRLDVNGTARVSGSSFLASTFLTAGGSQLGVGTSSINAYYRAGIAGNIGTTGLIVMSSDISGSGTPVYLERTASLFNVFSTLPMTFSVGSEAMRIFGTTRNIGINTTTDAGFRLDVNGTARVQSNAASVATILGTTTSARVVINNTTTTPNVGFSLQANSVNKWSLASYGATSDFTFYNDALSADALFIKGTTNNVIIGSTTDVASALLNVTSTTKGFLPPRMTTTQKNAITSPATGLQVFDTTLNQMSYYNGTTWTNI